MHLLIVGPGALGCLLASRLFHNPKSNDRITLLDYHHGRSQLINQRGILLEEEEGTRVARVRVISSPQQAEAVDALFICVKSYDIISSLAFCGPLFSPKTLCIFMQNGMSHIQHGHLASPAISIFGTTTEGATALGPGHIRHAGAGNTFLGAITPMEAEQRQRLVEVIERLNDSGLRASISENIRQHLWNKLFINVGINGLTVTHDCCNGDLLRSPEALTEMESVIEEALRVAKTENIAVDDPLANAKAVCHSTANNISSMLQDIRKGRRTEIEAINGAIVELGKRRNIDTSANQRLINEVKRIEANNRRSQGETV